MIVSREWYEDALLLKLRQDEHIKKSKIYLEALESFMYTVLTPEQQKLLEKEIEKFTEEFGE